MPRTLRDNWDVERRLAELGTNKAEMIGIAQQAAAARADSTEDDPLSGPGLLSWIYGTRVMRKTFRAKGWKRNSADNIPSVVIGPPGSNSFSRTQTAHAIRCVTQRLSQIRKELPSGWLRRHN